MLEQPSGRIPPIQKGNFPPSPTRLPPSLPALGYHLLGLFYTLFGFFTLWSLSSILKDGYKRAKTAKTHFFFLSLFLSTVDPPRL